MSGISDEKLLAIISDGIKKQGRIVLRFNGKSMLPTIESGDALVLEAAGTPQIGDVYVIETRRGYAAHRLIEQGEKFVFRGDNSIYTETFSKWEPIAKVIGIDVNGKIESLPVLKKQNRMLTYLRFIASKLKRMFTFGS